MSCIPETETVSAIAHLKYRLDGKIKYQTLMCNYGETKEDWEQTCHEFFPGSEFIEVRVESCGADHPEKEIRAKA
jgi:hypothetical protein